MENLLIFIGKSSIHGPWLPQLRQVTGGHPGHRLAGWSTFRCGAHAAP